MSGLSDRNFDSREALAEALAIDVAAAGPGPLALSGGATPKLFLSHLARQPVNWSKVPVTLVDERAAPETSERSNARMVRECLRVPGLNFIPLYQNEAAAARLLPLNAAVLGMGADGHTASFFPGGDTLAAALDPAAAPGLIHLSAPAAGEPRITFNLAALLQARFLALHIEGADKRQVLERAREAGPAEAMPVRAVLRANHPLTIYWCP